MTHKPLTYMHKMIEFYLEARNMIQENFGKALKSIREDSGISQEKFALSIGMDRTYYASVEAGKRNISLQNIQKIASGFGLSITELFEKVENS